MRVCLVGTGVQPIPPTGYGGVERTIAEYADALRSAGHDVAIVNEVRKGRSRDEYTFAWGLPRRLRRMSFDVLHASTPAVANRLAWAGEPFVYTTHSRHWFEAQQWTERFGLWLERRAVRRAAATVALTDRLADRIRTLTQPATPRAMEVIPIGVDLERFQPRWTDRTGKRALGVGVVRSFKRWELAAAALRGSGVHLTIVGPVPDAEYARRVIAAGDSVTLAGEVSDEALADWFARSDVLVHPSRVELLAGAVLQGLAAGLPVIGAAPIRGLVEPGRTGFVAPDAASPAAIQELISTCVRSLAADDALRHRMGDDARRAAAERFGWSTVVGAHVELYERLARAGALTRPRSPSP